MNTDSNEFENLVLGQIELLRAGKPLEAFDAYYDDDVVMFDNDTLLAKDKKTARDLQAGFMKSAQAIHGQISRYAIFPDASISVLHNTTRFVDSSGQENQIDGIHWQSWKSGLIVEERFFRGESVQELTQNGIFDNPTLLDILRTDI